jgi:radical SAM superfamily enzyme YgiQ (UPF0313 family)
MRVAPEQKTAEIALVNVPYGGDGSGRSMRPLGLSYLGAFLNARNISTQGFDFSDSKLSAEDLVDRYSLFKYPVVGLSFYNVNATLAYQISRAIKGRNPSCVLVGGGPHVSATHSTLFKKHPELDIAVRNEGEETLVEVVEALKAGRALSGIKGISYRSSEQIVVEPDRDRVENLDELPSPVFDFSSESEEKPLFFFDKVSGKFKRAVALVSSRSCPYSCSFCAIILIGRQWRHASPSKIVFDLAELEAHNKVEYGHVYFMDANFFVNAKRALAVAEALFRYRPGITFSFSTRVNQLIKGKGLFAELKRFGLRSVELGIESGSKEALDRFAKDTTPEQNDEALRILQENGLQLFLDFIMFDAEATLADIEANIDLLQRNGLDSYVPWDHIFSYMTPYLGTEIRRRYETLIGGTFDEDELPNPIGLFQVEEVRLVFEEMNRFQFYIPKLADALFHTEERVRGSRSWGREEARQKLNAVSIRRLPYMLLKELVAQAKRGDTISYANALPKFNDDSCNVYSFEEFLNSAVFDSDAI